MATSNYPFNQDTAFNSFTITDPAIVNLSLGRTYAQSELVPVNYDKIYRASLTDPSIKSIPLQEYVFVSDGVLVSELQEESINPIQSGFLKLAYNDLYDYWKNFLIGNGLPWAWLKPLKSPMVVATPTSSEVGFSNGGGGLTCYVVIRFNLVVFVTPNSIYA